nr:ATP-binding protein [Bacteroidales bacterium]
VIRHNKAASRLLGMEGILHLRQIERISGELAEAVSGPVYTNAQTVAFNNERGRVRFSVRVSLMRTAQQELRIVALNDIENELDEKEVNAWIRLTRVLTHESMNAVTPLTSLSETLLEGYRQTDDRLRDGLQTIRDTGKGLLSFVESYRKFTHLPEPEPAPFYVRGFLQRMLELLRHQPVWHPGIEARIHVEPADLMVYADERLIGQVVLNILRNACQAMGERGGKLLLHAYAEESGAVRIDLGNNGPVIEAALMEDIFLPFFTTKPDGSGIGLAVSRQLMHLCGGSILLHSDENLTTFTLLFP